MYFGKYFPQTRSLPLSLEFMSTQKICFCFRICPDWHFHAKQFLIRSAFYVTLNPNVSNQFSSIILNSVVTADSTQKLKILNSNRVVCELCLMQVQSTWTFLTDSIYVTDNTVLFAHFHTTSLQYTLARTRTHANVGFYVFRVRLNVLEYRTFSDHFCFPFFSIAHTHTHVVNQVATI